MLATKGELGINDSHAKLRIKQDWSPVLPRDREMLINEAVARFGAHISSPQTIFELLGDIPDADQEIEQIIDFVKQLSKANATGMPQRQQVSPGTPTGTTANTSE